MVEWTGKFAYEQVADDLRRRIADGEFDETGQLPSYGDLQKSYEITVTVARTAINRLKTDGLVVSHQGKGVFLTPNAGRAAVQLADPVGTMAELREELSELRERVARLEAAVAPTKGKPGA
ncbi:winged helix-turn-helix domain-containing protein [Streptomyces sp. Da 82-17]|uniref:winged helix-turn-helix domain-containing protein n=1 Tax=Streptomyces sp. Da 82-17 TaxID=3377116 RepID=UPI0038D3B51F